MKIIGLQDTDEINKQLNKKKLIITIVITIIIVALIIATAVYIAHKPFRDFVDFKIFRKIVMENNLTSISIDENQNNIYAYDKYIAILKNNKLIHYNSAGKEEKILDIEISNPITDINNRFLLIGEKNQKKLYLISSGNKIWEKEIEGNITRVCVNKNGYSAVIISGTTHKSVIEIFDSKGDRIFKTYLSNSTAMDVDISNDNKYVSFAELSTNGTTISSKIKTISIEKAKENPSESIVNVYDSKANTLILNIKYQEQNKLVCMYDNSINVIHNDKDEEITNLKQKDVKNNFADIELTNYVARVVDKSSFLNSENTVEIINVNNKNSVNIYMLDEVVKDMYCNDTKIALNLGSEVHFIGTNGWLIKKYTSSHEIKDIILCDSFAGVIYRNKIEIVNL